MRKFKLTKEEQWFEDHLEEFVPVSRKKFELIKQAIERKKKDAVLNIRVNSWDIAQLKEKARKMGVKYQTFITEILHQVAQIEN
ncbi:MAG TPA: antitoxin [Candidatus Omnitrophota bacterium]|nr:antitoxin [Candidatus Omnitrophota bacterium]HNQ50390.1 antitoxin [Candidatus Omnitrophota bacterium]HQO37714.1 antitoxin [Candidatus Omnitrophota bacterium]HQQ05943.1 antitoxin [Candidatus Omnitrophota bacterium]